MWKVVIADDEPKIREGLRETILGFAMEIEISREAKNGLQALEIVKNVKPDIVLIDINMPKLNGIKLIEAISDLEIYCKMIVVSGYQEFEYAKQAMTMGVRNYILKPIVAEELHKALCSVILELEQEKNRERYLTLATKQLILHKPYLREMFFQKWLGKELTEEEIVEQKEILSISLSEEIVICIVSVQDEGTGSFGTQDMSEFILKCSIQEVLQKTWESYGTPFIFSNQYTNVIAIISGVNEKINGIQEEVADNFQRRLGKEVTILVKTCLQKDIVEEYECLQESIRKQAAYKPMVLAAKQYIYDHFFNPEIDLSLVAGEIGMNANYISRLMKQQLGLSFKELLTNIRIHKSIELMRDWNLTINEISDQVGYNTQHYFSTAFKNVMGMAPSEYRKRL